VIGLLSAAALLLAAAGASKLIRPTGSALTAARLPIGDLAAPAATRATGLLELGIAVAALVLGGRTGAGLLALCYAGLAAMSVRLMAVARGADCGCFGRPSRISHWHTAINLGYLLAGLIGLYRPAPSLDRVLTDRPGHGLLLLVAAMTLAYLSYLTMTALPELLRLAVRTEVAR